MIYDAIYRSNLLVEDLSLWLSRQSISQVILSMRRGHSCNIQSFESGMEEDEEHIVEDQPLKVLDLFPKREPQHIQITVDKFSKLFDHLTCTICRELFKTPVYLKCSHRFCKECIQKYIRSSTKRSCPNCRGELTTKRDLHSDYLTESFIRFAFNDPKAFTTAIERADQFEILKGKTNELRRLESQPDIRSKLKDINEESSVPVPGMKRTKTEGEQPKKRGRKSASEKKIESRAALLREERELKETAIRKHIKHQEKEPKTSQALLKLGSLIQAEPITPVIGSSELMKSEIYRSSDKSKKKRIEVIQIDSNSQHERDVEQIRRQEFFPEEENDICSIHHIAEEAPERQQEKLKIFSFRDQKQMDIQECDQANYIERNIKHQQNEEQSEKIVVQPQPMLDEEEAIVPQQVAGKPIVETSPDVVRALSVLREEFGDNFQSKLIELTTFPFYGQIEVRKLPSSLITPILVQSRFKLSLRISLCGILSMIADMLNISQQWIKLFALEDGRGEYRELAVDAKLYQVNQQHWRRWKGVQLVQQGQLLRDQLDRGLQSTGEGGWVLFYSVDFSRAKP